MRELALSVALRPDHALEDALESKDLNAVIVIVGHKDFLLVGHRDFPRIVQLPWLTAVARWTPTYA